MKPILEIQSVSKRFTIQHESLPYLSLRDKVTKILQPKTQTEAFWALKDVSFNVSQGESLGILGRNGAGKSTLLKILSRITPPTSGKIISRGRIACLLEVGTGFHQELTGRENIFMNGSILGMRRAEITKKFDEIVAFSGVEKFLDTPLKHYSSGMQLRLAFSVAAHLDPDILIVDEVLAVGDAEFQKRCLGKMNEVRNDGKTLLFVSHSLQTLRSLCQSGLLLNEGKVLERGTIQEAIHRYTSLSNTEGKIIDTISYQRRDIIIRNLAVNGSELNSITVDTDEIFVEFECDILHKTSFDLDIHFKTDESLVASYGGFVFGSNKIFDEGSYKFRYAIKLPSMRSGNYKLDFIFTEPFKATFATSENIVEVTVVNTHHHTMLNKSSLKWAPLLLPGHVTFEKHHTDNR